MSPGFRYALAVLGVAFIGLVGATFIADRLHPTPYLISTPPIPEVRKNPFLAAERLLKRLAVCRSLRQPAEVFVTPSAFDATTLPHQLQADAARLRELRARLF